MTLRAIVVLMVLLPVLLSVGQGSASGGAAPERAGAAGDRTDRPNIVVIMLDDLDELTFQVALDRGLMPTLQRMMAEEGTRFRDSFVTNALCCPSRATFLTGQYSHNHDTLSNAALNGSAGAFDDRSTVATWLRDAGYRTGFVGRYLNGYGYSFGNPAEPPDPAAPPAADPTYVPPGWDAWHAPLDRSASCQYNTSLNSNGRIRSYMKDGRVLEYPAEWRAGTPVEIVPPAGDDQLHYYQTDLMADIAVQFVAEAAQSGEQPFFVSVMPLAPHFESCAFIDPEGPQRAWRTYKDGFKLNTRPAARHQHLLPNLRELGRRFFNSGAPLKPSFNPPALHGKPPEFQARFQRLNIDENGNGQIDPSEDDIAALVNQFAGRVVSLAAVDNMLARLVQALREHDEWENTVLIFTSDNGWFYGEHRMTGKLAAYEEAIRVPLYVRVPGSSRASTSFRMVANNDLAPTIAALAGVETAPEVDGRSLVPLLQNPAHTPWRRYLLIEHYLSMWETEPARFIDINSLFAARTARDAPLPGRVYIQYHEGIQVRNSYFLTPQQFEQGIPAGDYLWQSPPMAVELYTLDSDPFQRDNKLWRLEQRPNRLRIMQEQRFLYQRLRQLVNCQGVGCQSAED
jgi:N-acetylglucosamine-6-sulfatase